MRQKIRVGSRESRLAVRQAEIVMELIAKDFPELELELKTFKTTGDKILDRKLTEVGGKGLFVKELDIALREKKIDIAVHSLKDMPMETPNDLPILAYSKREDARDAIVLPPRRTGNGLAVIGCSSARRTLQLQAMLPAAEIKNIRGNIHTRLKKLDNGEYSAIVLASAGLKRMGLEKRINILFSEKEMIPAAGQGILAVQGRRGESYDFLHCVNDLESECCANAERGFVAALGGGCTAPIAAFARVCENELVLAGLYYNDKTGQKAQGTIAGEKRQARALGEQLAAKLERECK